MIDNLDLKTIHDFVNSETPEDLFLEFKTAVFPNKPFDSDRKNFSKSISGFANSSGGILIWGIKAGPNKKKIDVAKKSAPIKDLKKFENFLKRLEGKTVTPIVEGIKYRVIEENINEGYIAVHVPKSERVPHMAIDCDRHYYKRSGDSFYICEHFDIMDMINRKRSPILIAKVRDEKSKLTNWNNTPAISYEVNIVIENKSDVSARFVDIEIEIPHPFVPSLNGVGGISNQILRSFHLGNNLYKYVGGSDIIVHPKSQLFMDRITLNRAGGHEKVVNLELDYSLVAENMEKVKSKITRTKEQIEKLTAANNV
jgi:hypothetical protein